jgi:hypothetical protein
MYRYVFRRVKETIEHGVNARKSFGWQKSTTESPTTSQDKQQQQQHINNNVKASSELNFLIRPNDFKKTNDNFKRKYNCKHPCCNPFLSALTWVRIS